MGFEKLFTSTLESLTTQPQEQFQGYGGNHMTQQKSSPFLILIGFIMVELLVLVFGKYLWNEVATKLIPQIKPVKNIWQILGLSILLKLLFH